MPLGTGAGYQLPRVGSPVGSQKPATTQSPPIGTPEYEAWMRQTYEQMGGGQATGTGDPLKDMMLKQMQGSMETDPNKQFDLRRQLYDQAMGAQAADAAKKKKLEEQFGQQYGLQGYQPQQGGYGV